MSTHEARDGRADASGPESASGRSRREILKKGAIVGAAVAWATPTMQIINMAGAAAKGVDGSFVKAPTQVPRGATVKVSPTKPPHDHDGHCGCRCHQQCDQMPMPAATVPPMSMRLPPAM